MARQPRTSCAVSTTSRSFFTSSSYVTSLPSSVEANPHCGERQSWSSGRYRPASSMRRFSAPLSSSAPRLVVTRPRTTRLPGGTKRNGSKPPERSSSYSRKNR